MARPRRAAFILSVATASAVGTACFDLFHTTDWDTRCDTAPSSPGCMPGGTGGGGGEGGSGGGTGGAGGSATSYDGACTAWATAMCDGLAACTPVFFESWFDSSAALCTGAYHAHCLALFTAAGITMPPDEWAGCGEWVASTVRASCGGFLRYVSGQVRPPECNEVGSLANGTACHTGLQCAGGACKPGFPCGTCSAVSAAGGPCSTHGECAPGLACVSGTCKKLGDLDAPCVTNDDCFTDLVCKNGTCLERGTAGAFCDPQIGDCAAELYCNLGVCTSQTLVAAGQPCGLVSGQLVGCEGTATCKSSDGMQFTCVPLANAGEACDSNAGPDCKPPSTCVAGTCTPPDFSTCP